MLVVALTGGIGSGKSTVSQRFADLGVPVIDADVIAREMVLPGSPAQNEIIETFGSNIIKPDGNLDRQALRALVFDNEEARQKLEGILHPRIREEMQRRLQALTTPYAILVIPLLLETRQTDLADRVLVVDIPEYLQIERTTQRDGLSEAQIRQVLAAQVDRASRLAQADDVIENSGSLADLLNVVDRLHQYYLQLATIAS